MQREEWWWLCFELECVHWDTGAGLQEAGLGAGRMMGSVWGVVSVQGPRCMWEELSRGSWQSQVHNPVLWGDVQVIYILSAPGKRWGRGGLGLRGLVVSWEMFNSQLSREIRLWYITFADSCGKNTPIMTNFKLLIWHHWTWGWEEVHSSWSLDSVPSVAIH